MSLLHTLRTMAFTAMLFAALFTLYILLVELPERTSSASVTYRLPIPSTLQDNTNANGLRNTLKIGTSNMPIAQINTQETLERIGSESEKTVVSIHKSTALSSDQWVSWQDMDQVRYLTLLTAASIASSVICHPLHVIMMRQQVGAMKASGGLRGVYRSLQEAIASIGLRGLFRGWYDLHVSLYTPIPAISLPNPMTPLHPMSYKRTLLYPFLGYSLSDSLTLHVSFPILLSMHSPYSTLYPSTNSHLSPFIPPILSITGYHLCWKHHHMPCISLSLSPLVKFFNVYFDNPCHYLHLLQPVR